MAVEAAPYRIGNCWEISIDFNFNKLYVVIYMLSPRQRLVHLEWRREQVGIFKKTQRSKKNIKFGKYDPTWPQDNGGCPSALRDAQDPGGGGWWLLNWAQPDTEESQLEQGGDRLTSSGTQTGTQPLYRWDCRSKKLWGQRLSTLKCDAWNWNIKTGSRELL